MIPTTKFDIRKRVKEVLEKNPHYKLLGFGKEENQFRYAPDNWMANLNIQYLEDPPYESNRCGDEHYFIYFSVEGKTKPDKREFTVPDYLEDLINDTTPLLKRTIQL